MRAHAAFQGQGPGEVDLRQGERVWVTGYSGDWYQFIFRHMQRERAHASPGAAGPSTRAVAIFPSATPRSPGPTRPPPLSSRPCEPPPVRASPVRLPLLTAFRPQLTSRTPALVRIPRILSSLLLRRSHPLTQPPPPVPPAMPLPEPRPALPATLRAVLRPELSSATRRPALPRLPRPSLSGPRPAPPLGRRSGRAARAIPGPSARRAPMSARATSRTSRRTGRAETGRSRAGHPASSSR